MERSPASRLGIVSIDVEGNRRDWYFGELVAMSAGLSGSFAARGVKRGDVVMTLVGNRIEWVLSLLACWRMGAVALPCSTMLRRHDLEHRVAAAGPKLCVGEEALLAELPDGVPAMTMADVAGVLDEDLAQETPAAVEEMGPEDPALIVFTSGTTGAPRGVVHGYRYRLVEVGPQRLPRPLGDRRRRRHSRRPLRSGRAARPCRGSRNQRPVPGADRVPDAGPPHRPAPAAGAAADGLGGRAARPRDDRRLPGGDRPRARRRLWPDRDRPRDRQPRRRAGAAGLDGEAAARPRDPHRRGRAAAARWLLPHLLLPLPRRRAVRGRVVADRRPRARRRGRLPVLRGPRRRHNPLLRLPDRADRGRGGAARPPGGRRSRRRRRP